MKMMEQLNMILLAILAITFVRQGSCLDVRLSGGQTEYEGRVEVFHDAKWGSVCDDKWTHVNCMVVCSQLNYGGGTMLHDADAYGTCTGPIFLDDVECDGNEHELGECQMKNFYEHNCDHKEDVACKCDPNPNPLGTCLPTSHRIQYIDSNVPWVGRVEVKAGGDWGVICDDNWDDIDAHVFCSCLGQYNDSSHYRTFWSTELASLPQLPVSFDSINCNQVDKLTKKNIWECESLPDSGKCQSSSEAAGVACGPIPHTSKPEAPNVTLSCEAGVLTACFTSHQYTMTAEYLSLEPVCSQAVASNVTDGVCYEISMGKCNAVIESDPSHKHFCYDISYTQFDSNADTLLTDNVWRRTACCSQDKNGTAVSSFRPLMIPVQQPVYSQSSVNYTMSCFTDESYSGPEINSTTLLTRGEDVYCQVSTDIWDSSLFLVVPSCKFYGSVSGTPSFTFLSNKCPTTEVLGLTYYSFEQHSWGFKFAVPKFQDYDDLYVSCDAYVCDPALDQKPYCDRSCSSPSSRKRRSLHQIQKEGSHSIRHVVGGPYRISDSGFGPLLAVNTRAMLVEIPHVDVKQDLPREVVPPMTGNNSRNPQSITKVEIRNFKQQGAVDSNDFASRSSTDSKHIGSPLTTTMSILTCIIFIIMSF